MEYSINKNISQDSIEFDLLSTIGQLTTENSALVKEKWKFLSSTSLKNRYFITYHVGSDIITIASKDDWAEVMMIG
jgi:hypothetical protein